MDILASFFASLAILFFGACLKLGFKLIDTKHELRELKATCESILRNVVDARIDG